MDLGFLNGSVIVVVSAVSNGAEEGLWMALAGLDLRINDGVLGGSLAGLVASSNKN